MIIFIDYRIILSSLTKISIGQQTVILKHSSACCLWLIFFISLTIQKCTNILRVLTCHFYIYRLQRLFDVADHTACRAAKSLRHIIDSGSPARHRKRVVQVFSHLQGEFLPPDQVDFWEKIKGLNNFYIGIGLVQKNLWRFPNPWLCAKCWLTRT